MACSWCWKKRKWGRRK